MRNRSQGNQTETIVDDAPSLETLTQLIATRQPASQSVGKHRAGVISDIPEQKPRELAGEVEAIQTKAVHAPIILDESATSAAADKSPADKSLADIPANASWKASHLPRVFAGALLAMSVVGTWVLGVRFEASRLPEDFVSLFIGVGVVVVLWALLIASTPQELTLSGSVLTIHNSAGRETFDLADGLQPIDIIGTPGQRKWAVLLHRADRTSVVIRRHDVNAREFDPIVRHFREIVGRRLAGHATRLH